MNLIQLWALLWAGDFRKNQLFRNPAGMWAFAGQVGQPIFAGGALVSQSKAAKAQYDRDLTAVNSQLVGYDTQMKEWKKQRLEEIAALKIIIPNDLKALYKELQVKYL